MSSSTGLSLGKALSLLSLQFWQLYNAVTLFRMLQHPECKEWQVRGGLQQLPGEGASAPGTSLR